jgi:two-component system response regulator VanR
MRVLVVEDEPYMAEAIRDGLRLEAIAADIADDGGPSGDEIAKRIVASDSGMPILMLTAANRLDDKATPPAEPPMQPPREPRTSRPAACLDAPTVA